MCGSYGEVRQVSLQRHSEDNKTSATVRYAKRIDATAAISALSGTMFPGGSAPMVVRLVSNEKVERSPQLAVPAPPAGGSCSYQGSCAGYSGAGGAACAGGSCASYPPGCSYAMPFMQMPMTHYMSVPMAPQYPPAANAGHKLFVGMIPYSTGEAELHGVFSHFGPLMEVFMMREKDGRSKGCAFVRFYTRHHADAACAALNGTMTLPGAARALVVKYADASEPRAPRMAASPVSPTGAGGGDPRYFAQHVMAGGGSGYGGGMQVAESSWMGVAAPAPAGAMMAPTAPNSNMQMLGMMTQPMFSPVIGMVAPPMPPYPPHGAPHGAGGMGHSAYLGQLGQGMIAAQGMAAAHMDGGGSAAVGTQLLGEASSWPSQQGDFEHMGPAARGFLGGGRADGWTAAYWGMVEASRHAIGESPSPMQSGGFHGGMLGSGTPSPSGSLQVPAFLGVNPAGSGTLPPPPGAPSGEAEGATWDRLYVSNLSRTTTEQDLHQLFAQHGQLREVQLLRRQDGTSKGSAFVTYYDAENGLAASRALSSKIQLGGGRAILVRASTSKRRDLARGAEPRVPSGAAGAKVTSVGATPAVSVASLDNGLVDAAGCPNSAGGDPATPSALTPSSCDDMASAASALSGMALGEKESEPPAAEGSTAAEVGHEDE